MSDSDWGTMLSTTGWVVVRHTAPVSWGSNQQPAIALPSCKAEIIAASRTAQETVHLRLLVEELGWPAQGPTPLATDNIASRATEYNPKHHDRMKLVERRHFIFRECIEEGQIVVPQGASADILADFLRNCRAPWNFPRCAIRV